MLSKIEAIGVLVESYLFSSKLHPSLQNKSLNKGVLGVPRLYCPVSIRSDFPSFKTWKVWGQLRICMKHRSFIVLCCLLFSLPAFSQNATISGVLRDAQNGETLIGATVEAVGQAKGNVSNEYGFYSFTLPIGSDSIALRFSYVGYETAFRRIKLNGPVKLDISLRPVGALLGEVVIKANALEEKMRSTEMSIATISTREAKALPALFGETDIIKLLQLKPGISAGTEGTTGIFVRGGGGDQNLIVLDEAVVYNANHLFGFFSTFNSDAVKDVKVYKGGFPAQYGGRLCSVIKDLSKEGNN